MTALANANLIMTASSPHVLSKGALSALKESIQVQLPLGAIVVVADHGVTLTATLSQRAVTP